MCKGLRGQTLGLWLCRKSCSGFGRPSGAWGGMGRPSQGCVRRGGLHPGLFSTAPSGSGLERLAGAGTAGVAGAL